MVVGGGGKVCFLFRAKETLMSPSPSWRVSWIKSTGNSTTRHTEGGRCWVSTSIDRLSRGGWCHGHCWPFIESLQLLCSSCGDSTTVSRDLWHQIQHWNESSKKFGFYNPKKLTIWFRLYNPNQEYFYLFFAGAWE